MLDNEMLETRRGNAGQDEAKQLTFEAMSTTTILIRDELGLRVPSPSSVIVVSGGSVTFTAGDDADSNLYFSQSAAAILTPPPDSPVTLAAGASLNYTFGAPSGHTYGVIVQAPEAPPPTDIDFGPPAEPPTLVIQPGEGSSFPGPVQPIKTG
jgi:hypothetical protein